MEEVKQKKSNRVFKYIIFFWVCIFMVGLVKKTFQNDTFYTIKIGEYIVNHGIDMMDHFSFHHLPYTYPHWLYDVCIYFIYKVSGFTGIYISTICLFFMLLFSIFKVSIKLTEKITISSFATIFCGIALVGGFVTARAQMVTYILFVLELYSLEMLTKTSKKRYAIYLFLISLLICNIHVAVWPFFFILFLPFVAEGLISKMKSNNRYIRTFKDKFLVDDINIKSLLIIMVLCILTGLFTPIKSTPYTYLIKTMMGDSQSYIDEHQMVSLKQSIFTIIIVIETMFLALFNKAKIRDIFLMLGLSLMSIVSVRHIGLLGTLVSVCFARTFSLFIDRFKFDVDEKLMKFLRNIIVVIISFVLVIVFTIFMLKKELKNDYVDKKIYPVNASDYINKNINKDNLILFNQYNFGSYLLFRDIPVFIDSRADLYTKEFNGLERDIFRDFKYSYLEYDEIMDYYKFTHAITYKNDSIHSKLKEDANFKLIYKDKYFVIYERLGELDNE